MAVLTFHTVRFPGASFVNAPPCSICPVRTWKRRPFTRFTRLLLAGQVANVPRVLPHDLGRKGLAITRQRVHAGTGALAGAPPPISAAQVLYGRIA